MTGIDLTPDMIKNAKQLAEEEQAECEFAVMDAENPDFKETVHQMAASKKLPPPRACSGRTRGSAYDDQ